MNTRTTWILLLTVLLLGGYIYFVDGRFRGREETVARPRITPRLADRVTRFRIERGDFVAECRKEQGEWMLIEPLQARAEKGFIEQLLMGLETFEHGQIVHQSELQEQGMTAADYGFDPPRVRIEMEGRDFSHSLLIGRDVPGSGALFLMLDDLPHIMSTSGDLISLLPERIADLRDRRLFHRDPARVTRVEINTPEGFVRIVRQEDGSWMLRQPLEARADTRSVEALVSAICGWRAQQFVSDEATDKAVYGLDEPPSEVSLAFGTDGTARTLQLGSTIAGDEPSRYVTMKNEPSVMTMPALNAEALRIKVDDLRDRRLVSLAMDEIHGIRITRGEQAVELWREEKAWNITRPRSWPADVERVDALLRDMLSGAIHVFTPVGEDEAPMETPWEIALFRKPAANGGEAAPAERTPTLVLRTDRRQDEGGYLRMRRNAEPWAYHVSPEIMRHVSLQPVYYRDPVLLEIQPDQVSYIVLQRGDREQRIERSEEQQFRPVTSTNVTATLMATGRLFDQLGRLRAMDMMMAEGRDMAQYGLEEPQAVLTIGLRGDSGISKTLLIGNRVAEGEGVYGRIRGQEVIALFSEHTVNVLTSDLYVTAREVDEVPDDDGEVAPAPEGDDGVTE